VVPAAVPHAVVAACDVAERSPGSEFGGPAADTDAADTDAERMLAGASRKLGALPLQLMSVIVILSRW
jgi:hypothetical protein